jgi:sugar phosphate isomerase/epimerase
MTCMTTDYVSSTEAPEPFLRRIAQAGFTHVHWCHQWNTAYLYGEEEVEGLRALMGELGLKVLDLHGLVLDGLYYGAADAEALDRGLAVVANRIGMAARLGSDTVILHPPQPRGRDCDAVCEAARPFLDRALEAARPLGVRLAMENLTSADTWGPVGWLMERYEPVTMGLCYDSGHGNLSPGSLGWLEKYRGRLFSVHLHDNDGTADQHLLPFAGTVDWDRLTTILADSIYDRPMSLESNTRCERRQPAPEEAAYLREAFAAAERLQAMVHRRGRRSRRLAD